MGEGSQPLADVDDYPRSMRDPAVRQRRRAMLSRPHIAPLTAFAAGLRGRGTGEVPEFDPLDGGVAAGILFLFEKPGPKTSEKGGGSGFISRNNDDATAEATYRFMRQAGIPRELTLSWNVIPWWNGTRKITGSELRAGAACTAELIAMLPKLQVVMFVGEKATQARPFLSTRPLTSLSSDHPSPLVRARYPERWTRIPQAWTEALAHLGNQKQKTGNRTQLTVEVSTDRSRRHAKPGVMRTAMHGDNNA